jgi:hypothetical protein
MYSNPRLRGTGAILDGIMPSLCGDSESCIVYTEPLCCFRLSLSTFAPCQHWSVWLLTGNLRSRYFVIILCPGFACDSGRRIQQSEANEVVVRDHAGIVFPAAS